jgi:hypothetical protein
MIFIQQFEYPYPIKLKNLLLSDQITAIIYYLMKFN